MTRVTPTKIQSERRFSLKALEWYDDYSDDAVSTQRGHYPAMRPFT